VLEPLRHASLLLAVLEAEILARALIDDLVHGDPEPLARYSAQCPAHLWRAQEFSRWMIRLLHGAPCRDGESLFHNAL
jgi:p-hydroxybenzoate 3-monooxygenase